MRKVTADPVEPKRPPHERMTKAKRVLLVGNFLSRTMGTHSVCEELAERLRTAAWSVLTTSDRRRRLERLAGMVSTAWLQRERYDVAQVDVFGGRAFFWAEAVCWVLRRTGKPYILTLHGGTLPTFAKGRPARVRRLLRSAAAVTAPSQFMARQMRPYRLDTCFLPNAQDVSSSRFQQRAQPRPEIVWLRAFHRMYRPWIAIQALADVLREFPDARLTMIGPDKGDGSLARTRDFAEQAGIAGRLRTPGAVPKCDVPRHLAAGDIFLNTTAVESFGVSVLEAAAHGLCIVTTNAGAIPSIWTHEREVLMVPPDDSRSVAAAIRRILTEPGLAGRLSRDGRRKAEDYDWPGVLSQWDSLLSNVAHDGRHHAR